jgi:transcriptional regulator with XRE-family HTH domain
MIDQKVFDSFVHRPPVCYVDNANIGEGYSSCILNVKRKMLPYRMKIPDAISRLLSELNIRRSELAGFLGLARGSLTEYMKGRAKPSGPVAVHLAELAKPGELKDFFYGLADVTPDVGKNLFAFKARSYRIEAPTRDIAEQRSRYPQEKNQRNNEEALMEMIIVPCVPFSFISAQPNEVQSLDFNLRFPINFERGRLFKLDPLGIWICTRMAVQDDSMLPTIHPDELLLINKRFSVRSKSNAGKVFLVRIEGEVTARRLIIETDSALMLADNHRYQSRLVKNIAELKKFVIGQIVWKGGEVK